MYNNRELFEPYHGFIRGNMFKDLFDHYGNIYEVKPMNEQAELLTYIDVFEFALIDIGLYLDVYPDDQECIKIFNKIREEKKHVVKKYEEQYGPLSLDSEALEAMPWSWIKCPWPWEV